MPSVPSRYAACFSAIVSYPPPDNGWTLAQTVRVIAETRGDELRKQACGKDLIAWANATLDAARGGP